MNPIQMTRPMIAALLGVACAVLSVGACADERNAFDERDQSFSDASAAVDASDCRTQCSLDGRSVVDTCSGQIVETCPDDLACGAAKCQKPCDAAAADRSSNGCEFFMQMARMDKSIMHSCNAAFIVNTSTQPATVSLELDGEALDVSRSMVRTTPGSATMTPHVGPVAPGESVILFLSDAPPDTANPMYIACPYAPVTHKDPVPHRTGIGSSFRLKSDMPISLTTMFPFGGAASYFPSATLVLPVATWSKEHMIVNGWAAGPFGSPGVQIVASEDDTEVTIVPKVDIQDGTGVTGVLANQKGIYRLGRGQHLQLVQDTELTGSIVTSSKPTTLFGGNTCATIPSRAAACDVLNQQIPAPEQWGSEYVGVGYRPRTGNEHEPVPYRILAARDGTRLDYDPAVPPGAPTTMNAGQVAEFRYGTGDAFVVRTQDSEHAIYVAAHMTGGAGDGRTSPSYGGAGDPEFVNVVPAAQYLNSYGFFADPTYAETSLVVVRRATKTAGEFKDVWLECAGNLAKWSPIGIRGEYQFTRIDLSRDKGPGDTFGEGPTSSVCQTGLQRMRSEGPFTATLWGWDYAASYAYPGGSAQRKLVSTPLGPVN